MKMPTPILPVAVGQPNTLDRAIMAVAPVYGARRYQARVAIAMTGQYSGAKWRKAALKAWRTFAGSADADTLGDLPTLRARSRDLTRNNPVATGAQNTARTHTVGTGLHFRAQIDRDLLGMSEDEADRWERDFEKKFHLWAKSKSCDITLKQNFYDLQGLIFNTVFESGDCLVLRRIAKRPAVAPLALAVIEADRLATPAVLGADPYIRSGVRLDLDGAAVSYFVLREHPGDFFLTTYLDFDEVPAFGANSGEPMALHIYRRLRPEQTRGVPELAPVIEILKQLDRYTEAELMSAVVASFFTVFIKTQDGSGLAPGAPMPGLEQEADDVVLGPGSVASLGVNESSETASTNRANSNFDAFFSAIIRQIGVALGIPYELLIMHFTASYTASRAAIEMAQKFFAERREWLVSDFCAPVLEWFLSDAITSGVVRAPGFFESPLLRAAWLSGIWIPPVGLVLDPKKEWEGDAAGVALGALTLEEVALKRTNGDWLKKTEQRGREHAKRVALMLEPAILDDGNAPLLPPGDADGTGSESDDDTEGKPAPVKGKPAAKPAPGAR